MFFYYRLLRAVTLAAAVVAALAAYFVLSLYVLPQSYQSIAQHRPEPVVTDVSLSSPKVMLGQSFTVSVTGTNRGDEADMQIVTIGFPNLTRTDTIPVLKHDFRQTPLLIDVGREVGSEYAGRGKLINAAYASVEAYSRPWEHGVSYGIDLQVAPENEGRFAIFVKSVAFPHSWERAHYPREGIMDYQKEFVQVYYVDVAKP